MIGKPNTVAVAAIIALVAIIAWQWRRIEDLTAENRLHPNEATQSASAEHPQNDMQPFPQPSAEQFSHSEVPLASERFRELLRLRGDLGVLNRKVTQTADEAAENAAAWFRSLLFIDSGPRLRPGFALGGSRSGRSFGMTRNRSTSTVFHYSNEKLHLSIRTRHNHVGIGWLFEKVTRYRDNTAEGFRCPSHHE